MAAENIVLGVPIYICEVMHMAPSVVLGLVIHSDRIVLKDSVRSGDSKDSNLLSMLQVPSFSF